MYLFLVYSTLWGGLNSAAAAAACKSKQPRDYKIKGKVNLKAEFSDPSHKLPLLHMDSHTPTPALGCWETVLRLAVLALIISLTVIFLFVRVGIFRNHLEFCWCADDLEIWGNASETQSESVGHFLCMWWQGHSAWGCKYVCPIVVREQDPFVRFLPGMLTAVYMYVYIYINIKYIYTYIEISLSH